VGPDVRTRTEEIVYRDMVTQRRERKRKMKGGKKIGAMSRTYERRTPPLCLGLAQTTAAATSKRASIRQLTLTCAAAAVPASMAHARLAGN
jgi:hypothetical protein